MDAMRLVKGSGENVVKKYREHGTKRTREQGVNASNLRSGQQKILGIASNDF